MEDKEKFEVTLSEADSDTVVMTTATAEDKVKEWLTSALNNYDPTNRQYSAYLKDNQSSPEITQELLDMLAKNPQGDVDKIKQINAIVKRFINSDDIIGKTDETIETNINTDYSLSYKNFDGNRNKSKKLESAKALIDSVNEDINIERLIRNSTPSTYREGTYIMYLRHKNDDYVVDYFPLGVALVSDYEIGGEPYILIDMAELQARLNKIYEKDKKKKPLFFKNIEEEIKANYPDEVYQAYMNKDKYAKLDIRYSGVMRIGNMNGKYGLTPIFRALPSTLMLKTFERADRVTAKANAKKVLVQTMRKEAMGKDYDKDAFELQAYNHENLMMAWKQSTVLVTTNPSVESIKYVEPSTELTNTDVVASYRNRTLASLGISFLMSNDTQSVSTADISVSQLMKTINKITEQLEHVLEKWYKQILIDNGFEKSFAPKINIIDSEQMEMSVKREFATLLFSTLNCSYQTTLGILGIDLADEIQKRKAENDMKLDEVFKPHGSQYTQSAKSDDTAKTDTKEDGTQNNGGRPADSKNKAKQSYDKTRQKTLKGGA